VPILAGTPLVLPAQPDVGYRANNVLIAHQDML
jgi:hypothetical protein